MRFLFYWLICIVWAFNVALEKHLIGIGKASPIWFWVSIGFSFFFLLCAYGVRIEDKETKPPT